MLLATHPERAPRALQTQPPKQPVTGEVVRRELIDQLAGVANWPSIDALMHDRSLAMIAGQGISAWLGFGGRMRGDGLLSFGSVSDVASRVLAERRASRDGFLRTDSDGVTWAVLPAHPDENDPGRQAYALSWSGCAWPLDSQARWWAIRRLETRMARASRPGRVWTQADRVSYARWARTCRQLRLVDLAMRLLAALGDRQGCVEFTVADLDWSLSPAATDDATPNVAEVWAAACATTALQVAELRLGSLGWDPRVVRQATAVSEVERIGPETFGLQVSPIWSRAVAALSGAAPQTVPSDSDQGCSDC
jgi:hypothetical protein